MKIKILYLLTINYKAISILEKANLIFIAVLIIKMIRLFVLTRKAK